jgi:hypothetical protein
MSIEENKAIVRRYLEEIINRDVLKLPRTSSRLITSTTRLLEGSCLDATALSTG